jgi:hypothetical protein
MRDVSRRWIRGLTVVGLLVATGTSTAMAGAHEHAEQLAEGTPVPTSTPLLETSTHGDGVPIVYPTGKPLITARITEIPPGASAALEAAQGRLARLMARAECCRGLPCLPEPRAGQAG